eukprot:gene659-1271_t
MKFPAISSLFIISFVVANNLPFMTEDECKHTGIPYKNPDIVQEFISSKFAKSAEVNVNDLLEHHKLVQKFCAFRAKSLPRCSWTQYYLVLDHLRTPYKLLYDPGMRTSDLLSNIQSRSSSGSKYQSECPVIHNPTAKKLYEYVVGNKPVIIKGVADKWPATTKWTDKYLLDTLKGRQVAVSVSPSGDFDGPEPRELWNVSIPEDYVIARPAHWNTAFETFLNVLQLSHRSRDKNQQSQSKSQSKRKSHTNNNSSSSSSSDNMEASFYLEYFPLAVLGQHMVDDITPMPWANFLIKRTNLLWMGGGAQKTVGRMHFDRNENLMAMIRGSKTFHLYDPLQSEYLYADTPLRSASFGATVGLDGRVAFQRPSDSVAEEAVEAHTYSPVDIQNPNYTHHPLFKQAKGFACTIHQGDILFVPSHWWHQVISHNDEKGKSIGVNYFYEPFFHRPLYKAKSPLMQYNRYYSHISELKTVSLCDKENICFRNEKKILKKKGKNNEKKRKTKKTKKSTIKKKKLLNKNKKKVTRVHNDL